MRNTGLSIKIKALRIRNGLSQEQLASIAQINLRTVQRIEAGESEPRGDTFKRLASALNVTLDELINWVEKEDKGYLMVLNLSALSYLAFPLFGIIVPMAIWMLKKDKIKHLAETGRRLINFQITWCLIIFISYIILMSGPLFGFSIVLNFSFFNLGGVEFLLISFIVIYYVLNVTYIVLNSIRSYYGKKVFYQPAVPFLR
jgi:uncharacterized Tic20 family protein